MLGNDRVEEVKNEETSKEKGVNLSAASSVVLLCTLSVELGLLEQRATVKTVGVTCVKDRSDRCLATYSVERTTRVTVRIAVHITSA